MTIIENINFFNPILGGTLIGISAILFLLFNGRIAGASGIIAGLIDSKGRLVRVLFLVGMLLGGLLAYLYNPVLFNVDVEIPTWLVLLSGFLVGFGSIVGCGCTSGHGICGLGRLSIRSLVSVMVFLTTAVITATFII